MGPYFKYQKNKALKEGLPMWWKEKKKQACRKLWYNQDACQQLIHVVLLYQSFRQCRWHACDCSDDTLGIGNVEGVWFISAYF